MWPAPAKLNLFLHVLGRRPDGYHELQTVFQLLDYGDAIDLCVREDGAIRALHRLPGVTPESDLCVRAARLLQRESGTPLGAEVRLVKRLPLGGGLGGGSSDAATVLVALNHLWRLNLSPDRLAELGLRLGADVPVFVRGHSAWAEGVGERLVPVELGPAGYVVLAPPCQVSTREVFSAPELTRDTAPITIPGFRAGAVRNDCAPVVYARYPEVAQAREWLARYGEPRLTGTGACVFTAFPSPEQAQRVWAELSQRLPPGWQGFAAAGLDRSPLHAYLDGLPPAVKPCGVRSNWGVAKW